MMDTSELLRTPLNVFLLALILVLTFLAAYRIRKKWLRILVRIACSIGAVLSGLLLAFMLFARGKPNETVTEARNGPFKVLVRSQEFHHSGSINVDICVTDSSNLAFPKNEKLQCFLHGYDFSGLSVKWLSQQNIEIAFDCGRVTTFTNSALVYPNGPVPVEFHAILRDGCANQVP
jgi:energy-coupling factor transporter transmembrane protein EcfT